MAYQKRREPTRFPYTTEVRMHTGVSQISFGATFATAEAFVAFKMNVKGLDAIALRDRAKEVRDAGLTVDDVRATLKDGAVFVEKKELDPDGSDQFTCVRCVKSFQPVMKPRTAGGFSGNFRTLKADEVAKLDESRQKLANEVTGWFMGLAENQPVPADLKTRAVPVCPACRKIEIENLVREKTRLEREESDHKVFFPPYYIIEDVVAALYERDSKITNAINRKTYDEVVGHRTDTRRTDNRGGYRGNTSRSDRPRGERKSWNGAEYYPNVADTLVRLAREGKIPNSLEGLLEKSPAELETMGLDNAAKVQQLAQSHLDWKARQSRTAEVAGRGAVSLGEVVFSNRR